MSAEYDLYLEKHKTNVKKAFDWIRDNLPELLQEGYDYEWQIGINHDWSKRSQEEYDAYDMYFYGNNRSFAVVQEFNKAWLHHIHNNPHHWQHWVLINDESGEGTICIEMPHKYVIEMICDWWSFSWNSGDLEEIFDWYDKHKKNIQMHDDTRKEVEFILKKIKGKLDELNR